MSYFLVEPLNDQCIFLTVELSISSKWEAKYKRQEGQCCIKFLFSFVPNFNSQNGFIKWLKQPKTVKKPTIESNLPVVQEKLGLLKCSIIECLQIFVEHLNLFQMLYIRHFKNLYCSGNIKISGFQTFCSLVNNLVIFILRTAPWTDCTS